MFVVKRALKPAAAFGVATAFRQVRFPSPRRRASPRRVPRIVDATIGEFHHPSFRRSRRRSSSPGSGALEPAFPRDPGAARRSSRATRRESPRHRTRSRRRSTEPLTTHLSCHHAPSSLDAFLHDRSTTRTDEQNKHENKSDAACPTTLLPPRLLRARLREGRQVRCRIKSFDARRLR
jgi:hypothetical protein